MDLRILTLDLLEDFKTKVPVDWENLFNIADSKDTPVDYFAFYNSISSVYSSKIEGENIDYDSYFKHRFLKIEYQPDYTKKADDLFAAYEFIFQNSLDLTNLLKAHAILSRNLLPPSQQGVLRNNPMFVINSEGKIEYVAAESEIISKELDKLFSDIDELFKQDMNEIEAFYFASFIHLVFVKIHPFQDGNGRTARLLEKWFLISKLGNKATSIQLEKNYYDQLNSYYSNIRLIGLEYPYLNYSKSMPFLLMTINSLGK